MKKFVFLFSLLIILSSTTVMAQPGSISGTITDSDSREALVGANVVIQGTIIGASTDFDGKYTLNNISPGTYNLVVSYISYKTKIIEKVVVPKGGHVQLPVQLEDTTTVIEGAIIVATRRTDTETSMISTIKLSELVASGISNQQIAKSQDRNAAEVIRRIPGVTLIDERFVMVRGLNQRYNNVLLNNTTAPSSESDIRSFSFDIIPSSQIENILVYKTPASELPADFAGASILVTTKNNADKNSISTAYTSSFHANTTFRDFYRYNVGPKQWLGHDGNSLSLPEYFPEQHLNKFSNKTKTIIAKDFNKNWTPEQLSAPLDQRFSLNINTRMRIKKISVGNISALNYSNTNTMRTLFRANYSEYDAVRDKRDTSYFFNDKQYTHNVKVGILHNWIFIFGNNQKIELRNFFYQQGNAKTVLRNGYDYYGRNTLDGIELRYMERSTYSGQLGGQHKFNLQRFSVNWTAGYSYAYKNEPDIKRVLKTLNEDKSSNTYGQYMTNLLFAASPEYCGRVYMNTVEKIVTGVLNFENKFIFDSFTPELKSGIFLEQKDRSFNARLVGYAISNPAKFEWDLAYVPIEELMTDKNYNDTTGLRMDETSNNSDSYTAANDIYAGYIGLKIPIVRKINIYTGVRLEKCVQSLNSYASDNPNVPVNIISDTMNIFPSANITYTINDKQLLRLAYGNTINRPEFREMAPFYFYDFELKAGVRGNPSIKNAIIHNYDFRYEWYPNSSEMITLGTFLKHFINPIETVQIPTGTGWDFTYQNALEARNYGIELDVRKSLSVLKNSNYLFFLKDFTLVINSSLIKSEIRLDTSKVFAKNATRPMQGQSPYIVNTGTFYELEKHGLMLSLLYNIIGKRISAVGYDMPDTYEMPRHSLDFTFTKTLNKYTKIKGGIQNILNQDYVEKQFATFENANGQQIRDQHTIIYNIGRYYSLGIIVGF